MRRAVRALGLLAAAALFSAACSDTPAASPPPASVPAVGGTIEPPVNSTGDQRFEIQSFDVAAAEGPPESFSRVRTLVAEALDRYLEKAVLAPLRSGEPAEDLSAVFAGVAAEQVAGPDRAALVDEGLPPVGSLVLEKATATVAVLAGRGGEAGLATAHISTVLRGTIGTAPLTVERFGILELEPDGDTWKITGYEMRASRDTVDEPATTGA